MDSMDAVSPAIDQTPPVTQATARSFSSLPPEIRIEVWRRAIESRLIFLHDVIERTQSFSLPPVTQLDSESRSICLPAFERVYQGPDYQGPYVFFCDLESVERKPTLLFDALSLRVQRLAIWDCLPDDSHMTHPATYEEKLQDCLGRKVSERIDFGKLWFSNLKELWVVKVGDVDPAWGVRRDVNASHKDQLQQLARQFRYWVKDGIIEMASLDPTEPEAERLLHHGRCREKDCRKVNHLRPMIVSRVYFMDQLYEDRKPGSIEWIRVAPLSARDDQQDEDGDTAENSRFRWALVERTLMFSLRWDSSAAHDNESAGFKRMRTVS